MPALFETYRPRAWSDVIGQPKTIARLEALEARQSLGGRAYWLSGESGTGKTTIARLIAETLADDWYIEELDAGEVTPARLRDIEAGFHCTAPGKGGRALIVNEAHGLRTDTLRRLLVMLDPPGLPDRVTVVFTTTKSGQGQLFDDHDDAGPLLSRCIVLPLTNQGLAKPFAARAREIADLEGLNGQPMERYVRLVQTHKNNFRAVLMAIDAGEMIGA